MTAIDTSTAAVTALMDGVTEGPWTTGKVLFDCVFAGGEVVSAGGSEGPKAEANARFIAAARQLVPALLAERDAAMAGAVKVKPLVWKPHPCSQSTIEECAIADAPFKHRYQIQRDPWATTYIAMLYPRIPISDSTLWWESKGHADMASAREAAQADYEARILAALQPDPDARQADLAKAWQPIETAPRGVEVGGNNAVSWMVLAWPDGEGGYHRNSGMMVGEKFYAAPAFYIGGWHGVKHYALREIEIFPTHWMPDPPPPADLAAKIGGE